MWYGSEILTHHDNDMGELVYDACVVIHLAEITHEVICDSSLKCHKCCFFYSVTDIVLFIECIAKLLLYVNRKHKQITTSRPRRPESNDEYHNRQITYYGPDNQRVGRPQQYHYLRLIWVEQDTNLEYTLRYNTSRRGFWISSSPQKGRSPIRALDRVACFSLLIFMVYRYVAFYHSHSQEQ